MVKVERLQAGWRKRPGTAFGTTLGAGSAGPTAEARRSHVDRVVLELGDKGAVISDIPTRLPAMA